MFDRVIRVWLAVATLALAANATVVGAARQDATAPPAAGSEARVGDVTIALDRAEARPTIEVPGLPVATPTGEYLVVWLTLTNAGVDPVEYDVCPPGGAVCVNPGWFAAVDAADRAYEVDPVATAVLEQGEDVLRFGAELPPGLPEPIVLAFDVPLGVPDWWLTSTDEAPDPFAIPLSAAAPEVTSDRASAADTTATPSINAIAAGTPTGEAPTDGTETADDGTSYASPNDEFRIAWGESWQQVPGVTPVDLQLTNGISQIRLIPTVFEDARRCVENEVGGWERRYAEFAPAGGGADPIAGDDRFAVALYTAVERVGDRGPIAVWIACVRLDADSTLLVRQEVPVADYDAELPARAELLARLEVNGGPVPELTSAAATAPLAAGQATTPAAATPTPPGGADGGTTYTSPTYGYILTWDGGVWEVSGEYSADEIATGRDELALTLPGVGVLFVLGSETYGGDPVACLNAAFAGPPLPLLVQDVDVTPLGDDEPVGGRLRGEEADRAYASYRVDYPNDVTSLVYVECRTLVAGESEVTAIFVASEAGFPASLAEAQAVIDSLDPDGSQAG